MVEIVGSKGDQVRRVVEYFEKLHGSRRKLDGHLIESAHFGDRSLLEPSTMAGPLPAGPLPASYRTLSSGRLHQDRSLLGPSFELDSYNELKILKSSYFKFEQRDN